VAGRKRVVAGRKRVVAGRKRVVAGRTRRIRALRRSYTHHRGGIPASTAMTSILRMLA
jgi:hypothetical protein